MLDIQTYCKLYTVNLGSYRPAPVASVDGTVACTPTGGNVWAEGGHGWLSGFEKQGDQSHVGAQQEKVEEIPHPPW